MPCPLHLAFIQIPSQSENQFFMQASDEHSKLLRIFSKLPADIVLQAARAGDQRSAVELLMAVSRLDTDGQVPSPRSLLPIILRHTVAVTLLFFARYLAPI
jgi:hypothetical protein